MRSGSSTFTAWECPTASHSKRRTRGRQHRIELRLLLRRRRPIDGRSPCAIYAVSHGAGEAQIAAAIRSRDLSHKAERGGKRIMWNGPFKKRSRAPGASRAADNLVFLRDIAESMPYTIRRMEKTVQAVYEDGVLRPLEPI